MASTGERPGKVLFDNYGSFRNGQLTQEDAEQLVRYCLGIVHNPENSPQQRLQQAKSILMEHGYRTPNLLPAALADAKHLDVIVELIEEIVSHHPEEVFIDKLARNLAGALSNPAQREGAAKVLQLELMCGTALRYAAACIGRNELYPAAGAVLKKAAEYERHRPAVFSVLERLLLKGGSFNAACLLSSLTARYGIKGGEPQGKR